MGNHTSSPYTDRGLLQFRSYDVSDIEDNEIFEGYLSNWPEEELMEGIRNQFQEVPPPSVAGRLGLSTQSPPHEFNYFMDGDESSRRYYHRRGVGGRGCMVVVDDPPFDVPCDFFRPGRAFPVVLRHSNLAFGDDAAMDVRGAALRLATSARGGSCLDLVFNTGALCPFWNSGALCQFAEAYTSALREQAEPFTHREGEEGDDLTPSELDEPHTPRNSSLRMALRDYLRMYPFSYAAYVDGLKRAPKSYAQLYYYTQLPVALECSDRKRRFARFRLIPGDRQDCQRRLRPADLAEPWRWERLANERLEDDYLHEEWRDRCRVSGIDYVLQVQIHELDEEDEAEAKHGGPGECLSLNACIAWPTQWRDLATIVIDEVMEEDEIDQVVLNVGHLPRDTLKLLDSATPFDYNSVNTVRSYAHPLLEVDRPKWKGAHAGLLEYAVRVFMTNERLGRPSNVPSNVTIQFFGACGISEMPRRLNTWRDEVFAERGWDDFRVFSEHDYGLLSSIKIRTMQAVFTRWFIAKVEVTHAKTGEVFVFPVYDWLDTETTAFEGTPMLQRREMDPFAQQERKQYLTARQAVYRWERPTAAEKFMRHTKAKILPGRLEGRFGDLPLTERVDARRATDYRELVRREVRMLEFGHLLESRAAGEHFFEMEQVAETFMSILPREQIKATLADDITFGEMFLNGPDPFILQRVFALPDKDRPLINDAILLGMFPHGVTLNKLIESRRVFVADFKILDGLPRAAGRYVTAPVCYFVLRSRRTGATTGIEQPVVHNLIPIAILLHQDRERSDNPLFTPLRSTIEDWTAAKMWVCTAYVHVHLVVHKVVHTHLVIEPFVVAARRQLPPVHPVFKLLCPHFKRVLASNALGRDGLWADPPDVEKAAEPEDSSVFRQSTIIPGSAVTSVGSASGTPLSKAAGIGTGISNGGGLLGEILAVGGDGERELVERAYQKWRLEIDNHLPNNIHHRGLEELPNFAFRDDGVRWWTAIRTYAEGTLGLYYHSNEDVRKDSELTRWITEAVMQGHHGKAGIVKFAEEDSPDSGKPVLRNLDALVDLVTSLIWTCTCQHAAVTYPAWGWYAFLPNAPASISAPPPHEYREEGFYTQQSLAYSLPTKGQCIRQIALTRVLFTFPMDVPRFSQDPEQHFVHEAPLQVMRKLRQDVKEIKLAIERRNQRVGEKLAYAALHPDLVPNYTFPPGRDWKVTNTPCKDFAPTGSVQRKAPPAPVSTNSSPLSDSTQSNRLPRSFVSDHIQSQASSIDGYRR